MKENAYPQGRWTSSPGSSSPITLPARTATGRTPLSAMFFGAPEPGLVDEAGQRLEQWLETFVARARSSRIADDQIVQQELPLSCRRPNRIGGNRRA